jgi:hypothetical protein
MVHGFESWKDVFEVVGIPVAIAMAGLLWPSVQARLRRRVFTRLIIRELAEVGPYPAESAHDGTWIQHQQDEFVHKRIFEDPSTNRDFILTLPADIVYHVSQLWQARAQGDADQWLYSLGKLAGYDRSGEISKAHGQWTQLIAVYKRLGSGQYNIL